MNRTQRRLFTIFFIFLFTLVAPTVVLLAQGYRFSLENNIFIHSGSITIKSWPRDIDIYIDDQRQEGKTLNIINGAHTINGIKPGKYKLTCSKPGYSNWEKEIEVHSGVSTEFWNVLLFPEKEIQKTSVFKPEGKVKQIFLSPKDRDELILFTEKDSVKNIQIINPQNQTSETIFETKKYDLVNKEEGFNIEWNSNNKKFILPVIDEEAIKDFLIVNTENENDEPNSLNSFFPEDLVYKARWMFDEENELILLTKTGKLYFFDYKKQTSRIIDENVSGFDFADYAIYYTKAPNNIVWRIKQNDLENKKQITTETFDLMEEEKFIEITAYDKYRIFLNSEESSLIHNENTKKDLVSILRPQEKISGIQFSDDGKKLLCWNDHEVWYYMLRDWEIQPKRYFGDKITVTRSSEPIKNVQWMDNYENVILSTNNTIRVFEVDPRNKTNISELINAQKPIEEKNLIYNKDNQTAYFLDENNIFSFTVIDNSGFLRF
jgi:hypothetical protein